MEEAAIVFVVDAAKVPPVKTAQQQKLPTDFILPIHQQLLQQQLVTSRLQQRLQQQHSHRCDPQQRFQQQPKKINIRTSMLHMNNTSAYPRTFRPRSLPKPKMSFGSPITSHMDPKSLAQIEAVLGGIHVGPKVVKLAE